MQINLINPYCNSYPKISFCGYYKKKNESLTNQTAPSGYKMPDFETARAYASNISISNNPKENSISSITVNNLTLCSLKNEKNYGSYIISLESPKDTELKDKASFELYKCCKYMTMSVLNDKLKKNNVGNAITHISNTCRMIALENVKPEKFEFYTNLFNYIAMDFVTIEDETVFENAKNIIKDYYKTNWNKMKTSTDEDNFTYNELKNEKSLEDVEKKINNITFNDYIKFKEQLKNQKDINVLMILGIPNNAYDNSTKERIEKIATENIIVNGKFERKRDFDTKTNT